MKRDALITCAAVSAALAIAAGAFGAHGVTGREAEWLRTGGLYQLVHAVGALVVMRLDRRVAGLILAGAGVFAASLYAMAFGAPRWLGAVTPVGGVIMIAGWLWLAGKMPSGADGMAD